MGNCNCEPNTYHLNLGCCVPIVANANAYFTKSETIELIDEAMSSGCCITPEEVDEKIESAITDIDLTEYAKKSEIPTVPTNVSAFVNDVPYLTEHQSLSGYATEQWVTDQGYLTEHQQLKTINNESLIGEGNITISSGTVDLSNYYNKQEIDVMLDDKATQTWVLNQHYVTNSELIQYITNLQNQINYLQATISGCCGGGSGETIYRWITMTGENDYECSGTTKYTKEKKQQSTDGGNTWSDVTPAETRRGNTVLEVDSVDCGYVAPSKISGTLRSGSTYKVDCNGNSILSLDDTKQYITGNGDSVSAKMETAVVGNCVTEIKQAFDQASYLTAVTIPNSVSAITYMAFYECRSLVSIDIPDSVKTIGGTSCFASCFALTAATIGNGIESIGEYTFYDCTHLTKVTINATTPPELGRAAFSGTRNGTALSYPIYVPAASVNAYKSAWSEYTDRIFPIQ